MILDEAQNRIEKQKQYLKEFLEEGFGSSTDAWEVMFAIDELIDLKVQKAVSEYTGSLKEPGN